MELEREMVMGVVKRALKEDIGEGDLTSNLIIREETLGDAEIVAKDEGILAGMEVARITFEMVDPKVRFRPLLVDRARFEPGDILVEIEGRARAILSAERVCLNLLSHLCGVATLTHQFVEKTKRYGVKILDTRKTTPLLRYLERYAVRVGGGENHRFGLYDGILIKDNHIVAEGLGPAVKKAIERRPPGMRVEVETKSLVEVKEAILAGAEIIMLDNMEMDLLEDAVCLIRKEAPHILIEVSGGVDLGNVEDVARLGVDMISIGRLTHSFKALDLSLRMKRCFLP
jgi:nicotinate-nucleotide pyrophosphorylase (carboxylating)